MNFDLLTFSMSSKDMIDYLLDEDFTRGEGGKCLSGLEFLPAVALAATNYGDRGIEKLL